jgi:cellulose synthase (UDP-forming)
LWRNRLDKNPLNIPQAAGLATATLRHHVTQRTRWARGMTQILRLDNPLLGKGLRLVQPLCFSNSAVRYLRTTGLHSAGTGFVQF